VAGARSRERVRDLVEEHLVDRVVVETLREVP